MFMDLMELMQKNYGDLGHKIEDQILLLIEQKEFNI